MNESHPCSSDGADLTIAVENPLAADLAPLFRRHWAEMHADTPPESNHALPREGLAVPEIAFFVARRNGFAVAMGALKAHDGGLGEIKSMRTHPDFLKRGVADAILASIVSRAQALGLQRLSLETGSGAAFEPAIRFYRARGFVPGAAFGDYVKSDFNQFFHRDLTRAA